MKKTVLLLLLLSFAGTAHAALECEHPLLKKLADELPLFQSAYDPSKLLTLFRGVHTPQMDDAKVLRFLFQDPWSYSSSIMIETGNGSSFTLAEGAWSDQGSEGANEKAFLARLDEALKKTSSSVETGKVGEHPIWNTLGSLERYDQQPYYNWVQFVSPSYDTAAGYGEFVLNLEVPVARTHPNASSWETVVPLLVAPWEVTGVTYNNHRKITLKKLFNSEGGENRCVVDGVQIVGAGGPDTYLYLCEDGELCPQDASLLPVDMGYLGSIIRAQKVLGKPIGITRERPQGIVACDKRYPSQDQKQFDELIAGYDSDQRSKRLRSLIHLSTSDLQAAKRCENEIRRNLGFWAKSPAAAWNEKLLLARATGDAALIASALADCVKTADADDSFESRLETFAIEETNLTRRGFFRSLATALEKSGGQLKVPAAYAKLKAYLRE